MKTELIDSLKSNILREPATQVSSETRKVPEIVHRMNDWQYIERSLHRLLSAWGRYQTEWEDKVALHRHVWDQAEVVRRLRERIGQFPGGKADAAVSPELEKVSNAALHAPTFEDALDGIYAILLQAILRAYVAYVTNAHDTHDAPTIAMLHEVNTIKEQHYFWYRDYRRRHPHSTDAAYARRLKEAIAGVGGFTKAIPHKGREGARPCGVDSDFRLPKFSGRPGNWEPRHDIMPFLRAEFTTSIEARRLWWAFAYMLEMNLPDDQLAWLYWGHYMPWDWHHDISRHLWDESRHGNSGYSRLKDWEIELDEVGFHPYNFSELPKLTDGHGALPENPDLEPCTKKELFKIPGKPLSKTDLYEIIFTVGMVAENGHFIVKNESYDDFRDGADMESAEMMLFDIIDETTHVQYAHRWLPLLAEHAGVSNDGYRERAAKIRKEWEAAETAKIENDRKLMTDDNPAYQHYLNLLERIREKCPLKADYQAPERSAKPM
jgi:hypothetical protein